MRMSVRGEIARAGQAGSVARSFERTTTKVASAMRTAATISQAMPDVVSTAFDVSAVGSAAISL